MEDNNYRSMTEPDFMNTIHESHEDLERSGDNDFTENLIWREEIKKEIEEYDRSIEYLIWSMEQDEKKLKSMREMRKKKADLLEAKVNF